MSLHGDNGIIILAEMLFNEGAGAAVSSFRCQSLPVYHFQDRHHVADGEVNELCLWAQPQVQSKTVCMLAFGKKSNSSHHGLPLNSAWKTITLLVLLTLVFLWDSQIPRILQIRRSAERYADCWYCLYSFCLMYGRTVVCLLEEEVSPDEIKAKLIHWTLEHGCTCAWFQTTADSDLTVS